MGLRTTWSRLQGKRSTEPHTPPPNSPKLLHVALYARGSVKDEEGNPAYHWAFNLSSAAVDPDSVQESTKYDATNSMLQETGECPWRTRKTRVKEDRGQLLLARFTIAEVADAEAFERAISTVPVPQDRPGFDCKTWVRDAMGAAAAEAGCFGGDVVRWEEVERKAKDYMAEKRAVGRWKSEGQFDVRLPATWSFVEGREIVI